MTYSKENYPTVTDIHMEQGLYINIETMNSENRGTDNPKILIQYSNSLFRGMKILSVCYARFENQSGHSSQATGNTSDLIALGQASSPEKGRRWLPPYWLFNKFLNS